MGGQNTLLREKSKNFFEILFSLKGLFWGQKESFKTILGSILSLFCCYYSRLSWPDPKCRRKYPLPTNIQHIMSEGHVEDFFGSWCAEEETDDDIFDPDENWYIIFDVTL